MWRMNLWSRIRRRLAGTGSPSRGGGGTGTTIAGLTAEQVRAFARRHGFECGEPEHEDPTTTIWWCWREDGWSMGCLGANAGEIRLLQVNVRGDKERTEVGDFMTEVATLAMPTLDRDVIAAWVGDAIGGTGLEGELGGLWVVLLVPFQPPPDESEEGGVAQEGMYAFTVRPAGGEPDLRSTVPEEKKSGEEGSNPGMHAL
jgi:hypothetical protein